MDRAGLFLAVFILLGFFELSAQPRAFCKTAAEKLAQNTSAPELLGIASDPYFDSILEGALTRLQTKPNLNRSHAETLDRIRAGAVLSAFFIHTKDPHFKEIFLSMNSLSADREARETQPEFHAAAMNAIFDSLLYEVVTWKPKRFHLLLPDGSTQIIEETVHPLRQAFGADTETRAQVLMNYLSHRQAISTPRPEPQSR